MHVTPRRVPGAVLALLTLAISDHGPARAQPEPAFEVISIIRNTSGSGAGGGLLPGGVYTANNQTVVGLLMGAYRTTPDRIVGAPGLIETERYDIRARATGDIAPAQLPAMLQGLLRTRFNLRAHPETRPVPVYALVTARPDKTLGPRMQPASVDCADPKAIEAARQQAAGTRIVCGGQTGSGQLLFGGMSANALAQALAAAAGRPVLNQTGLTGRFDIQLEWSPVLGAADGVSIFTAVQEQLGLRLESTSAPMEVLVIDGIDRPTGN